MTTPGMARSSRPDRLDHPDEGEQDAEQARCGFGEERRPPVRPDQIGERPTGRQGDDSAREGVVDDVVDEADGEDHRGERQVGVVRDEDPRIAEQPDDERGERDRQDVVRDVEDETLERPPMDDLLDEHRKADRQGGERRGDEEDRRDVAQRRDRDRAPVGQLDGDELEADREDGEDDERGDPCAVARIPAQAREVQARGGGQGEQRDEATDVDPEVRPDAADPGGRSPGRGSRRCCWRRARGRLVGVAQPCLEVRPDPGRPGAPRSPDRSAHCSDSGASALSVEGPT